MFVAGLIYVIVSFIIKKVGVGKIKAMLPAQVVGPMIMVIGIKSYTDSYRYGSEINWTLANYNIRCYFNNEEFFWKEEFTKQIAILCGVNSWIYSSFNNGRSSNS